jgi:hypothetical protein
MALGKRDGVWVQEGKRIKEKKTPKCLPAWPGGPCLKHSMEVIE